jgi:hypothetical protein
VNRYCSLPEHVTLFHAPPDSRALMGTVAKELLDLRAIIITVLNAPFTVDDRIDVDGFVYAHG